MDKCYNCGDEFDNETFDGYELFCCTDCHDDFYGVDNMPNKVLPTQEQMQIEQGIKLNNMMKKMQKDAWV